MAVVNLRDSCRVNIFLLKIFFLWYDEHNYILKTFRRIIGFLLFVFTIGQTLYLIRENDVEQFIRCASVSFTLANGSYKYVYFKLEKTQKLMKYFDEEIFQPKNEKQLKIFKRSSILSNVLTAVYNLAVFSPCTLVALTALHESNLTAPMWLPYITQMYWVAYPISTVYAVIAGFCSCIFDCLVATFMIQIGTQCDLLNDDLQNLLSKSVDPEESYAELKKCIFHHKLIVKFSDDFVDVFHNIIFAQFAMSVPVYCQTMYLLSILPPGLAFITQVVYSICIFFEPFVICWFGNEVIIKSDNLSLSAYSCRWYDASPKFKKAFVYFMHRTQKPITMYVGKLFPASVAVWVTIAKSSWSYYLMLNRVYSREQ